MSADYLDTPGIPGVTAAGNPFGTPEGAGYYPVTRPSERNSMSTVTPESSAWPSAFAPRWASSAEIEDEGATIIFTGCWTVPAIIRDVEPLDVVTMTEEFTRGPDGLFEAHGPRVSIGSTGVWADHRLTEVAATLREIADALDPEPAG